MLKNLCYLIFLENFNIYKNFLLVIGGVSEFFRYKIGIVVYFVKWFNEFFFWNFWFFIFYKIMMGWLYFRFNLFLFIILLWMKCVGFSNILDNY